MELVSIIIPVYNVEKYLKRCLESIIHQTYKNLEIILVDDGSTDNSAKICNEYLKKDTRVQVFHKKNGGLSSARNYGLMKSKSNYICFIDSDDYIEKNMIEIMYKSLKDSNADISIMNKIREFGNNKVKIEKTYKREEIINSEKAVEYLLLSDPSVCNKMFRKKLFHNIKFPIGKYYEDILTTPFLLDKADRIFVTNKIGYHYVQRKNSIINNEFNINKMDYYNNSLVLKDFINKKYPNLKQVFEAYQILIINTLILEVYDYKTKYANEYLLLKSKLKNYKYKFYKNKYIPIYKRFMILLNIMNLEKFIKIIKKYK